MKEAKKGTQRLYKVRQEARAALRRSRSIRDWEGFPNKQNRQSLANVIACDDEKIDREGELTNG